MMRIVPWLRGRSRLHRLADLSESIIKWQQRTGDIADLPPLSAGGS